MKDFSGNSAFIKKTIPKDRLFDSETIDHFQVSDVQWRMSIKPGIRDVTEYTNGRVRLEEIEVFELQVDALPEMKGYFTLLSQIHSKVMYPCVVYFHYKNKHKIAAWKTIDSAKGADREILKSPYISSWIHNPPASEKTKKCEDTVYDLLMNGEGDIRNLYNQICQAIVECSVHCIGSRKHLIRILYDLAGKKGEDLIKEIDSTKRFTPKKTYQQYEKKEYSNSFTYVYEYEDIWFALMNDENIRGIIQKRRYENVEEMIMRIDEKWGNYDGYMY